jgi:hypothetical protein
MEFAGVQVLNSSSNYKIVALLIAPIHCTVISHLVIGDRLIVGCTTNVVVAYNLTNFNYIGTVGEDGMIPSTSTYAFGLLEDDVYMMGHESGQISLVEGDQIIQSLMVDIAGNSRINRIYKTSRPNEMAVCTMNGLRFINYDSEA